MYVRTYVCMYVYTAGVDGESTLVHLLNAKISYSEWKNNSSGFANLQQIQVLSAGENAWILGLGCQIRGNGNGKSPVSIPTKCH